MKNWAQIVQPHAYTLMRITLLACVRSKNGSGFDWFSVWLLNPAIKVAVRVVTYAIAIVDILYWSNFSFFYRKIVWKTVCKLPAKNKFIYFFFLTWKFDQLWMSVVNSYGISNYKNGHFNTLILDWFHQRRLF